MIIAGDGIRKGDGSRTMDFGLITDPLKGVPFNWREVRSMKNHTPRRDGPRPEEAEAREARQQRHNKSGRASVLGGRRNRDNLADGARGTEDPGKPEDSAPRWGW
jgi:hypothetical protein